MKPLDKILAKSVDNGGLTLLEHTQQVTQAIEVFAQKFTSLFNKEIVRKGAIIHDLGKAHPHFQRKIQKANKMDLVESLEWDFAHRHEISSLGFLPIFPQDEWDDLIDLVVAHHKSMVNDVRERGILDLVENDRMTIENHLKDWEKWHEYGLQILEQFDIPVKSIDKVEAEKALNYVVNYCEGKRNGYSALRGLLKSADHFASAFIHETSKELEHLFEIPDLNFYHKKNRESEMYPLSQISSEDTRNHTLVVAPTGAGKTDFLLRRCKKRVFYTLPFQASINAMWERIKNVVPNKDIRLLHATSKIIVKGKIDEQILQPLAGSAVKILTPHQIAAIIFGTPGYESVILDLEGTDVILDEIHTYSDYSRAMVLEIVRTLLRLNCNIHIGTATMPSVLYNSLLQILGGEQNVYQVKLSDEQLDTYDRHKIYKTSESCIEQILEKALASKEKVLVIFNTIRQAQEAYGKFKEIFPDVPKMLIHSRFKRGDRVNLEKRLKTEFNGDENNDGISPCLVVSTQVVEVSLDISFDRMITQCAPLDSLIQRFGRVHRKRSKNTIGTYKSIHVVEPTGNSLPYKSEILKNSYGALPEKGEILRERLLQSKIDSVYPEIDTKEIDVHLIFKNGRYTIRELTNCKRAILVEALEIESATCILESDKEAYLNANWENRLYLEIPVNYKSLAKYKSTYEQLEVGRYPFLVRQDIDKYETFGLQLEKTSNFI